MATFMKFGTIKGWATETGHVGWIPLAAVSLFPEGTRGAAVSAVICTRHRDGSTIHLWEAGATGDSADAVIELTKGNTVYLKIMLQRAMITSFHVSADSSASMEQLTLNFAKIEFDPGDVKL